MDQGRRKFPLIADGEPVIEVPVVMRLYENEDLITNIHGDYQEKDYSDITENYQFIPEDAQKQQVASERLEVLNAGKTYAQKARAEARKDVRQKRQKYLSQDVKHSTPAKIISQKSSNADKATKKAVQPSDKNSTNSRFTRFTDKLHQEQYILAELPVSYEEPQNTPVKKKKNNYDFLKRSQIYNRQEIKQTKERKVAQELNLSRFDDVN